MIRRDSGERRASRRRSAGDGEARRAASAATAAARGSRGRAARLDCLLRGMQQQLRLQVRKRRVSPAAQAQPHGALRPEPRGRGVSYTTPPECAPVVQRWCESRALMGAHLGSLHAPSTFAHLKPP